MNKKAVTVTIFLLFSVVFSLTFYIIYQKLNGDKSEEPIVAPKKEQSIIKPVQNNSQ